MSSMTPGVVTGGDEDITAVLDPFNLSFHDTQLWRIDLVIGRINGQ